MTAAKPAHSSAAANADAAAPGADAAEIEAVRLAALASMNKQAGGAPDALGLGLASKQAAGVTPMLRLRPTVVQQVCEASTVPIRVHQAQMSSILQVHHAVLELS